MANPVVVTGAAGFIGSHVAEALLRRGDDVLGIDSFDPFYDRSAKEANVRAVEATAADQSGRFELAEVDICDEVSMAQLFRRAGTSSVIHLAAKAGVRPSIADPVGYARTNLVGTSVVLESARLRLVTGQLERARDEARDAMRMAVDEEDARLESNCQQLLGTVAFREGRYQQARTHMQAVLDLSRKIRDEEALARLKEALLAAAAPEEIDANGQGKPA